MTNATTRELSIPRLWYFYVLDCLPDLADIVSHDFIQRPQLYTDVDSATIKILGDFFVQYGTDPRFLSPKQRKPIFIAIFGNTRRQETKQCNNFAVLRDNFLKACARYSANVRSNANIETLTNEVQTELDAFRAYLLGIEGSSLGWSLDRLEDLNEGSAYKILRTGKITNVFGVSKKLPADWPNTQDPSGNILVEEISKKRITRAHFAMLFQAAEKGRQALFDALSCDGAVSDELVSNCNSWNAALSALNNSDCRIHCC